MNLRGRISGIIDEYRGTYMNTDEITDMILDEVDKSLDRPEKVKEFLWSLIRKDE
jgi:hypothetical protein